ncbi:hypothetical protein ACL1IT_09600 [Corynebacterium striatum]
MDAAQILDTLVWAALTLVCLLNFLLIRRVSRDLDALWDYLGRQHRIMANLIAPSEEPRAEKTPKPTVQAGHFDELLEKLNQQKGRRA